ncbi:MAG TPA: cytochrome c [Chromatiaceae bacterium]|nr:cytochrome c [Chromatiaceae bacterium]
MKQIMQWLILAALGNSVAIGAIIAAQPDAARRVELIDLLKQDCGACHGMRLKGGLGPALTPDAIGRLSIETISATILHGRPGTPMPPWQPFMSQDEAVWLAGQLKAGVD